MKKVAIIVIILITACTAILGVSIATGRVAVSIKDTNQVVLLKKSICDKTIIEQYNNAWTINPTGDDMKRIVASIKSKDGYVNDSSCLFMLIKYNVASNADKLETQRLYEKLVECVDAGDSPSATIDGLSSIQLLKAEIDSPASLDGIGVKGE